MLHVGIDVEALRGLIDIEPAAREAMQEAGQQLMTMTRAHIVEEASVKLHTRRQLFIDSLSHFQADPKTFVVALDASARWIDDGMPAHNMLDDLLKSPKAKRAADGSTYLVVPFEHGPKGPTEMTPTQSALLSAIKQELRSRSLPYAKVERDAHGAARTGRLHSFSVMGGPLSTAGLPIGRGPFGSVAQGWSQDGKTGTPLLANVQVYQKKGEGGKVQRTLMTFRVASSKHRADSGRWDHPGLEPAGLMDEGLKWAVEQWEREIAPQVAARLVARLA